MACRACRHGDRCSRLHNRPTLSPTLLLQNMYQNPALNSPLGPDGRPLPVDPEKVQQFFEDFYEDLFLELDKYGELEYLNVCDNLADHMVGNVYVKFADEHDAAKAAEGLTGRYYAGKPITVEFSPVTDFKEATCRQYEEGKCGRGGYCNFMHVRPVARDLRKQLFGRYRNGTGGSTKFHESSGRGGGGGGGSRRYDERDRYDDRRSSRRSRDDSYRRSRSDDRRRESSAERRARIASWNTSSLPPPPAHEGHPPLPPEPQVGYVSAPPQQIYNNNNNHHTAYNNNSNNNYSSSRGGSGANTIPIANPKWGSQRY